MASQELVLKKRLIRPFWLSTVYTWIMQHLLVLIIAALILGLTFTVTRWPGGLHMTFSQHVARARWSKIYYALLFLVTLPVLAWFIAAWLVPGKQLPEAFLWFTYIAVLFQILCTWFPEEGGWKTAVHRVLTGISGVAMLPLVVMLATASSLPLFVKFTAWVAFGFMMVLLAIALSHQKGYKWALLLQVGYYAAFFLVLLVVTYS